MPRTIESFQKKQRTVAIAAWVGGWLGGPILAIVFLFVESKVVGAWGRGYVRAAAIFWTMLLSLYVGVFAWDLSRTVGGVGYWDPSRSFLVVWAFVVVTGVVATTIAVVMAVRRQPDLVDLPAPVGRCVE